MLGRAGRSLLVKYVGGEIYANSLYLLKCITYASSLVLVNPRSSVGNVGWIWGLYSTKLGTHT